MLSLGGNSNGAGLAGAVPHRGPGGAAVEAGKNTRQMLDSPLAAYVLWGIEPGFDVASPAASVKTLRNADKVIIVASHAASGLYEMGDVILPLTPQPESEGSMVNYDGTVLAWSAAVKASGQARSGWKILRKLGGELGLDGFDQVSLAEVQNDMQDVTRGAYADAASPQLGETDSGDGLYRIGDLPMYAVDALCRRAQPLQKTMNADTDFIGLNAADAGRIGLADGATARVSQGGMEGEFEVRISDRVPAGGAWLHSATCNTRKFGHAFAPINVEVA